MIISYIMIFVFFVLLSIFGLYFFTTYVFPRKIEEIAKMLDMGQTKLAIKKLSEILEKDDRNIYAHYLLAEAYMKVNNIQYAILEYRQVLKIGKYDDKVSEVDVRLKLARIHKERKAIEDSKKEYLILTKLDSVNYEHFFELGKIYFDAGQTEKASYHFRKSISNNNQHDASYYYMGQIYYRTSNYNEAKQMFIETIKIDPSNYKAHYFLGLVLRQIGDYEWALKEFETAQKSEEIKVKAFLAKGTCYLERDQHPKAIVEFERGLKFARKGSDTELNLRYFLAASQEYIRDLQSAISNWEQIAAVNRNFKDVQEKLKAYSEFRQDDRVKDFMIASLSQFEHLSRKITESIGLSIMDVEIISDTEIEILATEADAKWRNTRTSNKLVRIMRTTDTVSEKLLRKLHENIREKNANRIIIISTGEFTQGAIDFANTRPIELLSKGELIKLLRSINI